MNKILCSGIIVCTSLHAALALPKHSATYYEAMKSEVQDATRKGAKAKILYRVVDDEGTPITNAIVHATWQNDFPRKTWEEEFVTDTNGMFVARANVGGRFGCHVVKKGYYRSSGGVNFCWRPGVSPLVLDGKWQPYGEEKTLIVKRKKNPIDMPMLLHTTIQVPVTNVWLGLDMESFKWVKPYGEGKHADMLLRFNSESENRYYAKWATMDVSFTNNSHAGFYILPKDVYSFMKSAYEADTNMTFHASRTFRMGRVPSDDDLLDKNLYMVFRTRTKLDDEGKLVSAHYGKIYGPWSIWKNTSAQMIFFNAIPNNTNLEDVHTYNESELLEGR